MKNTPITIPGPFPLEGILTQPEQIPVGLALICHPHPLHQGTMHNKVVTTLARAANACNLITLRFNFRGVGKSQGSYDHGRGEVDDAKAALTFLQNQSNSPLPIIITGFSFGGHIATALAASLIPPPAALVTIAPALSYEDLPALAAPHCPWLSIHGDKDDVILCRDNQQWLTEHAPDATLKIIPEAGHFFHGKLLDLQQDVIDFLQQAIRQSVII